MPFIFEEGGGGKLVCMDKGVSHIVTFLHIFTFRGRALATKPLNGF